MKKILIVDDEKEILDFFKLRLKDAGYEALTASSGEEALMLARATPLDLVILDIAMPEMDGYETCRRLQSDARTKGTKVVFLTCKELDTKGITQRCDETGACGYLSKLSDSHELLAEIKSIVG